MLSQLSIRDIVLIEALDIDFSKGLSVLTGETGAGKSILLDALSLALGARGDASLVRHGARHGQVTALFDLAPAHPVRVLLEESGIDADPGEPVILTRRSSAVFPKATRVPRSAVPAAPQLIGHATFCS